MDKSESPREGCNAEKCVLKLQRPLRARLLQQTDALAKALHY